MRHPLKVLFLSVFCLSLLSCEDDDEPQLNTVKQAFTGTQLRTDGYYYLDFNNGEQRRLIYFLYRDGSLLYGGAPLFIEIADREAEFANGEWDAVASPEKTFWGLFTIADKDIKFDQWHLRDGTSLLSDYQTEGKILNDSSFVMTTTNRTGEEGFVLDEIYRFKAFPDKPDSTNQFL